MQQYDTTTLTHKGVGDFARTRNCLARITRINCPPPNPRSAIADRPVGQCGHFAVWRTEHSIALNPRHEPVVPRVDVRDGPPWCDLPRIQMLVRMATDI